MVLWWSPAVRGCRHDKTCWLRQYLLLFTGTVREIQTVLGMQTFQSPSSENSYINGLSKVLWRTLEVFGITSKRRFWSLFCRSAKMKLIQFALLDHVRHSRVEYLFQYPRPPCSSYSNPSPRGQLEVQSCLQLVRSRCCRWLAGEFLDPLKN